MFKFIIIIAVCVLQSFLAENNKSSDDYYISPFLTDLNKEILNMNRITSKIAWDSAMGYENVTTSAMDMVMYKSEFINEICERNITTENGFEKRIVHLLCRGPKYFPNQARDVSKLMEKLSTAYCDTEICIKKDDGEKVCLKGEPDLENLMKKRGLTPKQLSAVWKVWHNKVGPKIREFYPELVNLMNLGAFQNGYNDIGETWREELEIENLEQFSRNLYLQIKPLYILLHGVIRYRLVEIYGKGIVNPYGKIPAHLLGNMWAQDWSSLMHLFFNDTEFDMENNFGKKLWSPKYMVALAEDFYTSMGFPKMTQKFWQYSKIEKTNSSFCHGSAANMFNKDDYRMLVCAEKKLEDFYVIHHEMGHIHYYMAYQNQPAVFQDGANSAFQESIGDSIMLGVYSPQHLYRLGLISDEQLSNPKLKFSNVMLFYLALSKIPQIPYGLMLDRYRWDIFNGKISPEEYNRVFWRMNENIRGIKAPEYRSEKYFDAGAKFHVADNTPYIRYFLSSFIQADIFKAMCKRTIFGRIVPTEIPFALNKCDIYGSKTAGKHLWKFMSLGSSIPWYKTYEALTGKKSIDAESLKEYFEPVYAILHNFVEKNNVPLGW